MSYRLLDDLGDGTLSLILGAFKLALFRLLHTTISRPDARMLIDAAALASVEMVLPLSRT
jgi:hypothetical protein